jgi:hypothetical protein
MKHTGQQTVIPILDDTITEKAEDEIPGPGIATAAIFSTILAIHHLKAVLSPSGKSSWSSFSTQMHFSAFTKYHRPLT